MAKDFSGEFKTFTEVINGEKEKEKRIRENQIKLAQGGRPQLEQSTSSQGLQKGYTRMTFICSTAQQDDIKYIAFKSRKPIKDILGEAIRKYVEEWEDTYGKIEYNG